MKRVQDRRKREDEKYDSIYRIKYFGDWETFHSTLDDANWFHDIHQGDVICQMVKRDGEWVYDQIQNYPFIEPPSLAQVEHQAGV